MPFAVATIVVAFLADACKGLVGRVLVALGIGAITAVGINAMLTGVSGLMSFSGAPAQFLAALQAMGVQWFMSTILSAITTRATLQGLTSDAVSFWVLRRGIPGA